MSRLRLAANARCSSSFVTPQLFRKLTPKGGKLEGLAILPIFGKTGGVLTNTEVIHRLQASRTRVAEISAACGVPEGTLRKIAYGETTNPRMDTIDAVRDWLEKNPQ